MLFFGCCLASLCCFFCCILITVCSFITLSVIVPLLKGHYMAYDWMLTESPDSVGIIMLTAPHAPYEGVASSS